MESNALAVLALATGVAVGLAAVGLQTLIEALTDFFQGPFVRAFSGLGDLGTVLAPVVGALIAGPLIFRFATEAKGHGVPEVMEAVALHNGRIRPRVATVKALASAFTIGSGGSAGREGPVVQIGAAIGSMIGRWSRASVRRMRLLVASGSAAGIAAVFNAPLAGVFFALEVVLQRFTTRGFATVVLSAVVASTIWRAFEGNAPVLEVPRPGLEHGVELVFYLVLGVAAALVAAAFVASLYHLEGRFERLRLVADLRPALGAVAVGLLALGSPLLLGTGLEAINDALRGNLSWPLMLALLGGKVVATSFTLGSGASGGVFSPSLFLGAMLGGSYAVGLHALFGDVVGSGGAYAMVGMAAVFAAAAQAPITAILIVFEMTNDYLIMLPLMLACVTSAFIYRAIKGDSVYMYKLRRRGIDLVQGRERHLLETVSIMRAVDRDYPTVTLPATRAQTREALERTDGDVVIVRHDDGTYAGMVFADDLPDRTAQGDEPERALGDGVVRTDLPSGSVRDSLDSGLRKLAPRDLEVLPVIDVNRQVLGATTRDRLLRAYWHSLGELGRLGERREGPGPEPPRS